MKPEDSILRMITNNRIYERSVWFDKPQPAASSCAVKTSTLQTYTFIEMLYKMWLNALCFLVCNRFFSLSFFCCKSKIYDCKEHLTPKTSNQQMTRILTKQACIYNKKIITTRKRSKYK